MWELRFVGTKRKLKETGKILISDGPESQTQRILDCVSHGGKKTRSGAKKPGLKF